MTSVRVAVVQASPVLLDRDATVAKAVRLTDEAATGGARLVLFPEAFVPAYPRELSFGTVIGRRTAAGRLAYQRYWDQAVDVPGPATEALGAAARRHGVYLAIGVIEVLVQAYQPLLVPALGTSVHVVTAYVLMIAVLMVRPYGLFGTKEVERV